LNFLFVNYRAKAREPTARRCWRQATKQARRGVQAAGNLADLARHDAIVHRLADAQRQIDRVAQEVNGTRREITFDLESAVRVGEGGDGRTEHLHPQVHRHRDTHAHLLLRVAIQHRLSALGRFDHLQIGIAALFLAGALRRVDVRAALAAVALIFGGFALGRIVSIAADGMPVPLYLGVLGAELLFATCAVLALRQPT
jgi:hypothetical protein